MDEQQGDLCTRDVRVHVRALREDSREVDFTFSTDRIDRFGEIVEQSWRLENYALNPTVLWSHDSREAPIGKAKNVGVVDGELRGTVVFASEKANARAEQTLQLIREDMLRAGSVGFIPHELRYEMRDGKEIVVLADNELIEFSITPVPANPDALARRRELAMARRKHQEPEIKVDVVEEEAEADAKLDTEKPTTETEPIAVPVSEEETSDESTEAPPSIPDIVASFYAMSIRAHSAEKRCIELELARTAEQVRADGYALELCKRDLNAMIGRRITAAEVPGMVDLFASNRELYNKQLSAIRGRPAMVLLDAHPTIGTAPLPQPSNQTDSGEALLRRVRARSGL